jgi:hypothetical protein
MHQHKGCEFELLVVFYVEDMSLLNPHLLIVSTAENSLSLNPSIIEKVSPSIYLVPPVLGLLKISFPIGWSSLVVCLNNINLVVLILPICPLG